MRVFRLSRITDKVSYASKAEHDFTTPEDFDPWAYARRADWQLGEPEGTAQVWISERIAWLVERDFGRHGSVRAGQAVRQPVARGIAPRARPRRRVHDRVRPAAPARRRGCSASASTRACWSPAELVDEAAERLATILERHAERTPTSSPMPRAARARPTRRRTATGTRPSSNGPGETPIRPERFARLVALAGHPDPVGARRRREPAADGGRVRAAADHRAGAARGPRRAERRQLRRRQLRAVCRDPGRGDRRRPRALQRQLRAACPAPAARGEGAGRRDRPARRPSARGQPRVGAAEDRRGAGRRPVARGPPDRAARRRRRGDVAHDQPRDRRLAPARRSSTTRRTRTSSPSARSSPTR